MEKEFYIYMLGRNNIMHNYKEAKKIVLEEVEKYNGVTWETGHEIYQLWYQDIITDKQFFKLCDFSHGTIE